MGDQENDELLPDGWRVEVRVRKNGRKDKCYFAPSHGLKFNSKEGVLRYLNSNSSEETVKGPTKQLSKKVMIERAAAEGLPPGWIKELKVTKTGHKVRRDPYYIDPVSGYIFRSMKDAVRYVETGEIGRLAYKPKDKDSQDEEDLEDDKNDSPTVAKKPKLAGTGMEMEIIGQSTKLTEIVKDEDAHDSASTGECISRSEHTSGGAETELRSPNLSEDKDSDKMDGANDSDKNVHLSTPVQGVLPDRQSSESVEIRDETKTTMLEKCRPRNKKVLDLPRRASKRLAGLALEPTPELKTSNRARRTVVKQSDETVASPVEGLCSGSQGHKTSEQPYELEDKSEANCGAETSKGTKVSTESSKSKHPSGAPNGCMGKTEREYKSDKKQGCAANNQDKIETDIKADEKPRPPIDLPLGDLLSDPCIAFAIKTLTGATFETSSDKELSLESNNSKYGLAALEEHAGKQKEYEGDKKLENVATVEQYSGNVENNHKTDEKPEMPLDSALADIWRDPCIEFAIKTLTGAIPVGYDLDIQDYFQQQLNSSQTQGSNNFCQTEFLCQQYDTPEKPVTRQPARTGNLSIQNSGGTSFHQQSGKRCNECH